MASESLAGRADDAVSDLSLWSTPEQRKYTFYFSSQNISLANAVNMKVNLCPYILVY
jgi:hypothetical protein